MYLLSPYRHLLSSEQIATRLLWLGLSDLPYSERVRWVVEDRLLYHYVSYLLVSDSISVCELRQWIEGCDTYEALLAWVKAQIRASISGVNLKTLGLHDAMAWRVAVLHHVACALSCTHDVTYDLPFEAKPMAQWQLRLVHAQPVVTVWGQRDERLLWLEEVEAMLSLWPETFEEEEHPTNGDKQMLGYEGREYVYLTAGQVLCEVRQMLRQFDESSAESFVRLYNRVVRLGGAYAARPLANAVLMPAEALWDTLQQHRPFALRAQHWLDAKGYIPQCTRGVLDKSFLQAERPDFVWGQHERKRYLEQMQRSVDVLFC